MIQGYFTDNISDEKLAELIDETLRFEKAQKSKQSIISIWRILPAVAMVAVVIGAINILSTLPMFQGDTDGSQVPNTSINMSVSEPTNIGLNTIELFVPYMVEKSFFENRVLAVITDTKVYSKITAYYTLRDGYYVLDSDVKDRERDVLLSYYKEYTNLTGYDIIRMYINNDIQYDPQEPGNIIEPVDPNDPYAHVRFNKTRDSLLLDVEWHTYETFLEFIEEYKKSDYYTQLDEDLKNSYDISLENYLNQLKDKKILMTKSINGKPATPVWGADGADRGFFKFYDLDLSECLDSDGYYIWQVFPYYPYVCYIDEYGNEIRKRFSEGSCPLAVKSKAHYNQVLKEKIIPFCDSLLEQGLISQEDYDWYTTFNPLDYYVNRFFN